MLAKPDFSCSDADGCEPMVGCTVGKMRSSKTCEMVLALSCATVVPAGMPPKSSTVARLSDMAELYFSRSATLMIVLGFWLVN